MSCSQRIFAALCLVMVSAITLQAQSGGKTDPKATGDEGVSMGEVMHLVRFQGVIPDVEGTLRPNVAGVTFSLYDDQYGSTPLWMETQNVQVDEQGHYTALLGSTKTEGVPPELFAAGQARWLGVQVSGQLGEERTVLGSVPYAVQAGDAESLGGRRAEEYALAAQLQEEVRNELRSAGFNIPDANSSGGGFRTQGQPEDPGSNANPRAITNEDLDEKLNLILGILNEPPQVFSFQLCTEPAFQSEWAGATKLSLQGVFQAKAGADVYGNGGVVSVRTFPNGKVEWSTKAAWDVLKLGICADLRAAIQRLRALGAINGGATQFRKASLATENSAAVATDLLDQVANLDEDALLEKMVSTANGLQFDPAKLQDLLDRMQNLSFDVGPLAILQDNEDRAALADSLPMPPGVRTVVSNPAALLTKFKDLVDAGLCGLSDNAPALDPLLGPICELAENEKYAKLLDRVDEVTEDIKSTTTTINSRVNTVSNRVQDVLDRLPTDGNCKLFCHSLLFP